VARASERKANNVQGRACASGRVRRVGGGAVGVANGERSRNRPLENFALNAAVAERAERWRCELAKNKLCVAGGDTYTSNGGTQLWLNWNGDFNARTLNVN
jgi:hypothetical protein